jgi:hypothetical protein
MEELFSFYANLIQLAVFRRAPAAPIEAFLCKSLSASVAHWFLADEEAISVSIWLCFFFTPFICGCFRRSCILGLMSWTLSMV